MKRTSSMVYQPTNESWQVKMIVDSYSEVVINRNNSYNIIEDRYKNLDKKRAKGEYNSDLAIDEMYRGVDYCLKHCNDGKNYSVTARFTVACDLVQNYEEAVRNGYRPLKQAAPVKRSKNMVYNPTMESLSICKFIDDRTYQRICSVLDARRADGTYNRDQAIDVFYKEISKINNKNSTQARFTAACDLVKTYEDDVRSGHRR